MAEGNDRKALGAELLQQQRFDEAAQSFDEHLREHPDDPGALLQLGICHLLNRSEAQFLALHERARRLVEGATELPAEVGRLWTLSRSLVAKLGVTALAVGLAAGCDKGAAQSPEVTSEPATATAAQTAEPSASVTASAEASVPPTVPTPTATAPATAPTAKTPAPPATTAPAHRYSGGVIPNPTPAHRYSGGVDVPTPAHRYSGGVIAR